MMMVWLVDVVHQGLGNVLTLLQYGQSPLRQQPGLHRRHSPRMKAINQAI